MFDSIEVVRRTLGSYRLVEVLGQGGMGVVYLGEHCLLGRRAAIKVLRSEYSRRAASSPASSTRRAPPARSATRAS